jgi:hypothetical protein
VHSLGAFITQLKHKWNLVAAEHDAEKNTRAEINSTVGFATASFARLHAPTDSSPLPALIEKNDVVKAISLLRSSPEYFLDQALLERLDSLVKNKKDLEISEMWSDYKSGYILKQLKAKNTYTNS